MEEKKLLTLLKQDDERAFRLIFDLYIRKLYQFIYGYIKNKPESEDLTQQVFEKLWQKRSSIDSSQSLSGFLFTMAYHVVIDHFRKRSRNPDLNFRELVDNDLLVSDLNADHLVNSHEFQSLYQQAVSSLPAKRREIFLLSRHEGLSNKDIAARLHLSVKTVENQMTAALFALRKFFADKEFMLLYLLIPFL